MAETYTALGIESISKESVFEHLMPLVEIPDPDDGEDGFGVSIAEFMTGVVLQGKLVELLGEPVAKEASGSAGGKAVFATTDYDKNHCIARYERGRSAGRTEVSNYDVIEDGIGHIKDGRDHAHWTDLFVDCELEWVFGENPRKLEWRHYKPQLA
ncbi:hypothetical protein VSU19_03620 [Verrucomicrobiales bacterium BCK34]|nr:hypothetical protein [Verrucomicrobiales bacterium BCK34]